MCKKTWIWIMLLIGITATSLLTGCGSSGSKTVAVVGDYKITIDEFNDFFRVRYPFPSAQEEFNKRREILDTVIVRGIIIMTVKMLFKIADMNTVTQQNITIKRTGFPLDNLINFPAINWKVPAS